MTTAQGRYQAGFAAAVDTYRGSLINHGRAVETKGYGSCTATKFADTYWYIKGWNDAVATLPNGGQR